MGVHVMLQRYRLGVSRKLWTSKPQREPLGVALQPWVVPGGAAVDPDLLKAALSRPAYRQALASARIYVTTTLFNIKILDSKVAH